MNIISLVQPQKWTFSGEQNRQFWCLKVKCEEWCFQILQWKSIVSTNMQIHLKQKQVINLDQGVFSLVIFLFLFVLIFMLKLEHKWKVPVNEPLNTKQEKTKQACIVKSILFVAIGQPKSLTINTHSQSNFHRHRRHLDLC